MKRKYFLIWALLVLVASFALIQTGFQSKNHDSIFYGRLVEQLSNKPVVQWVAPKWQENFWGHDPDKYVHDHFAGHILPGILLTKLGVPAKHALHIVQMIFGILALILLVEIASFYIERKKALHLLWILQLIPIAFTYKIRANHEYAVLFWMVLGIYGAIRVLHGKRGHALWGAGIIGSLLVKGAPVILLPAMLVVLAVLHKGALAHRIRTATTLLVSSLVAIVTVSFAYDWAYLQATGSHFLAEYWRVQIHERSLTATGQMPFILQKLSNFWYYLNRPFVYTAPWSLFALYFAYKKRSEIGSTLQRLRRIDLSEKERLYLSLTGLGLIQILAFSISNRLGSRYIFPAFFMFGTIFSIFLLSNSKVLQKWSRTIDTRVGVVMFSAFIWFATFSFRLVGYILKNSPS